MRIIRVHRAKVRLGRVVENAVGACCAAVPGIPSEVPPVGQPLQELHREPAQLRRLPYCQNAYSLNLYLFTSSLGVQGAVPPGRISGPTGV